MTSIQKEDNRKHDMSDDEDMVLSQALDEIERGEPEPKIPKLAFKKPLNRLSLNLDRFKKKNKKPVMTKENTAFTCKPSTSVASESAVQPESQALNQSVKNRILCTPSDDENSQNEQIKRKVNTNTMKLLNKFKFKGNSAKNLPLQNIQQQNVEIAKKSDGSNSQNDSAYDTMTFDASLPSTDSVSCKITAKTPALFPPSDETQNKIDEDDLSYLDTFEIV